ncbi:hypothetical protein [Brunnivagina elsteri]|uniref:Uncharacterized protein n=1 Tax=Brunnivagina elsteri CCALA 953 TaxID=987040 RepID=A0A2A2TCG2_9CYAN|nr:hypothetical protein [Calothrix elsteri]PAX51497.1 hypothetical protein CK510_24470 [Calothrix elsteri CCALA 953]
MKYRQPFITGLLISAFSLLLVSPVQAEPKITATPQNLTVAEKRCFFKQLDCTKVKRNLLLRSSQEINNIKVVSLDLNRTDGAKVFPANSLKINLSNSTIPGNKLQANQPVSIPLEFDFQQVSSGEFSGVLLIISPDSEITIPITVKVKDHWLIPLLVLLLGVGLGITVSTYRTEGINRDEVLVQVARLRNKMRADDKLDNAFQNKIEAYLIEVETALENKRWQISQDAVAKAQTIWDKWRKDKQDWLDLLSAESNLRQRLQEENPSSKIPYLEELGWEIEKIQRERANQENPQQVSQSLQNVRKQLNNYLLGKTQSEEFNELVNKIPTSASTKEEKWKLEAASLQKELRNLSPSNSDSFKEWQTNIKTKINDLITDIQQESTDSSTNQENIQEDISVISRNINNPSIPKPLQPVPNTHPLEIDSSEKISRYRLRFFNVFSYLIAIFLLGGAGFTQLYAVNNTFGANGLTDYFALLAWGFGAEATRESVTKVLQEWKSPGVRKI